MTPTTFGPSIPVYPHTNLNGVNVRSAEPDVGNKTYIRAFLVKDEKKSNAQQLPYGNTLYLVPSSIYATTVKERENKKLGLETNGFGEGFKVTKEVKAGGRISLSLGMKDSLAQPKPSPAAASAAASASVAVDSDDPMAFLKGFNSQS